MKHKFGGIWTQRKLEVLEEYLQFYVTALKNTPFTLHYVDAFAGTGNHSPSTEDGQTLLIPLEDFRGSVKTALEVTPAFGRYHFNDLDPVHFKELQQIQKDHPDKHIALYQQDANAFVPDFCAGLGSRDRAVLFLDPYSTQLDWETLKHVAASEKVDLWLLFPLSVILRMTPRDGTRIRPEWGATLNRLLGTEEWQHALYQTVETAPEMDLFGELNADLPSQRVNTQELGKWVTGKLRERFAYVAEPITLASQGRPLFLFYFAVSNPSEAAWRLADKAARHIIKKIQSR